MIIVMIIIRLIIITKRTGSPARRAWTGGTDYQKKTSICMYVCMYVYIYIYIYNVYVYIYIYIYVCVVVFWIDHPKILP